MHDASQNAEDEAQLRTLIATLLADGLETEVWPRAETSEMVNEIVGRLGALSDADLKQKLIVAGFTDHTVEADDIEQPCETCMYYLVHRKYCDLPELQLPVEPDWSCRLWRI